MKALRAQLDARRGVVASLRSLGQELAEARALAEQAREKKDFAKLGELEHGKIPELASRLAQAEETARSSGVSDAPRVLGEEDVAATLALWTGIPVSKMLEAEAGKLMKMEERLGQRVIGQTHAVGAVSRRGAARARGPARSEEADRFVLVPRPERRRQDRARQGARRVRFRRRAARSPAWT